MYHSSPYSRILRRETNQTSDEQWSVYNLFLFSIALPLTQSVGIFLNLACPLYLRQVKRRGICMPLSFRKWATFIGLTGSKVTTPQFLKQ